MRSYRTLDFEKKSDLDLQKPSTTIDSDKFSLTETYAAQVPISLTHIPAMPRPTFAATAVISIFTPVARA